MKPRFSQYWTCLSSVSKNPLSWHEIWRHDKNPTGECLESTEWLPSEMPYREAVD
ncbi:MAG: hypothetical protein ABJZ55_04845 [Fuerstiella sp.]